MGLSVFPTPSAATTSFYGIVGQTNSSTSVTIPSGTYSFVADNANGTLTLGSVALASTSGIAYLTSQVTSATVDGLNKGVTWTTTTLSTAGLTSTGDSMLSLVFSNGRFFGGSGNGFIVQSFDGINWTRMHTLSASQANGVAFGNNIYVAILASTNAVITSTDTITWTSRAAGLPALTGLDVVFGNGIFVAAGSNAENFSTSTDGITWVSRAGIGNFTNRGLGFGNGLFLLGRDNGWLSTSTDGITWTSRTSNMNSTVRGFAHGNNTFIAVGASGQISSSTDGITWVSRAANAGTNELYSATFNGGTFVVVGLNNTIRTSTDGITWTTRTGPFGATTAITRVASGNGIYVAAGGTNQAAYAIGERKWFLTRADSTTVV